MHLVHDYLFSCITFRITILHYLLILSAALMKYYILVFLLHGIKSKYHHELALMTIACQGLCCVLQLTATTRRH